MSILKPPSVRLYGLLAREAPLGVVFRRGPSKQVLLVHWKTDTDEFLEGQWFKGRIYERRCDLSPKGDRLIYFSAKYRGPLETWTAVSRPPYLTALALWAKGDAWGGGGLFGSESQIQLNHRPGEMELAEGFRLPRGVRLKPFGADSGWGEDQPIWGARLERDGWRRVQRKSRREKRPEIWAKRRSKEDWRWELRMMIKGMHERGGPWYVVEHVVVDQQSEVEYELGRTDWADWCRGGDLVFTRGGKLFRLGFDRAGEMVAVDEARCLIDLTDRQFEAREAPREAKTWNEKVPGL